LDLSAARGAADNNEIKLGTMQSVPANAPDTATTGGADARTVRLHTSLIRPSAAPPGRRAAVI
jgi:hypothetical protein